MTKNEGPLTTVLEGLAVVGIAVGYYYVLWPPLFHFIRFLRLAG